MFLPRTYAKYAYIEGILTDLEDCSQWLQEDEEVYAWRLKR